VVSSADQPLPFADDSFDVVCALDILEHLDDDAACAREIERICKPGGAAIFFVPALQLLWGYNDEYSHHRRRYLRAELDACVRSAGFELSESGYFNLVLFAPTLLARIAQRLLPRVANGMEHATRPSIFNGVLAQLFRLELPFHGRVPLPLGTSAYAIARKPGARL
jgi:SAM-dependent methyltransferase